MTPKRIQRKRTKGWLMPENAVYVGRPGKWGNPYTGAGPINHKLMKEYFQAWIERPEQARYREQARAELAGKNLACWCPLDQPCHADILLKTANRDRKE